MSRLTDLIGRVERTDASLAAELSAAVKVLADRREFGLNFERHVPESVELPGRRVRRGDKVRFLAPRKDPAQVVDRRLWWVTRLFEGAEGQMAELVELGAAEDPAELVRAIEDLVVVAEFRDPIYPGLRPAGEVAEGGESPAHAVINGENYHALEALAFAFEGRVDVIYIDPPYNTRDKDWKYNNDYVDADDDYRHSKWLAFMERRLKLALRLLNPRDSVLIVTIDEKEVHRLGLLVEQVFSVHAIQMVTIVTNQRGVSRGQEFARVDEYAFVVLLGAAQVMQWSDDMLTSAETLAKQKVEVWSRLMRRGTDSQREDSPKQFYPIFIDPERKAIVGVGEPLGKDEDRHKVKTPPGQVAVWPLRKNGSEGRWTLGHTTLARYLREGWAKVGAYSRTRDQWSISYLIRKDLKRIESGELVVRGKDENGVLIIDVPEGVERLKLPRTVWHRDAHNAGTYGSELLNHFIPGRKFPFPKSLYAVEDMVRFFVREKPAALIVDFFAGSGTTAHAVMRLNNQDEGSRRCLLVTNNEVSADEATQLAAQGLRPGDTEWEALGICKHITEPRLRAAVTGETPAGEPVKGDYKFIQESPMSEGFEQNVKFFDLTYEDANEVRYGFAFDAIAPFLWLRAGSRGRCIMSSDLTHDVAESYAVLFDIDAASAFLAEVEDADITHAFVVCDSEAQYQLIEAELPERVEAVRLYEGYLRSVTAAAGAD